MTDPPGQGGGKGPDPSSDPSGTRPDASILQEKLEELRGRILEVDEALVKLVGERRGLVLEIGRLKAQLGLPVLDPSREATVVRRVASLARDQGVDEELMRDVVWRIIASAREEQDGSA
jgi:chorismate mutase